MRLCCLVELEVRVIVTLSRPALLTSQSGSRKDVSGRRLSPAGDSWRREDLESAQSSQVTHLARVTRHGPLDAACELGTLPRFADSSLSVRVTLARGR